MLNEKYYIGLDIGTNSVGWAVTDEHYNLCKFNGKAMWGSHLFDEAETAADRRMKRSARRRNDRKKQRIKLLQALFADEMAKVDETFFLRLNSSRLYLEDKPESIKSKYPLFIDKDYNDIHFHKEYPTIYHLRKELIDDPSAHDIRLVYLAIHHILKNRGHFLIEGDLSNATDFDSAFEKLLDAINNNLNIELDIADTNAIEETIRNKSLAKSVRAKRLETLLSVSETKEGEPLNKEQLKHNKTAVSNICKWIVGNKGDVSKISNENVDELDKKSFSLSDGKYEEEIRASIEALDPDICYVVDMAKLIYDWSVLVEVLDGKDYLSYAKVEQYNRHKENLKSLKYVIRKYCDYKVYKDFFNGTKDGATYANYIGEASSDSKTTKLKQCSKEDFYKNIKKILEGISEIDASDEGLINSLIAGAEAENLLPLQRNKDNGTIPHQAHEVELDRILENANVYLPFLSEPDEDGISVASKIKSIFTYRVPYFVGPLSSKNASGDCNSWMVRKEDGYIYPWNFDQKVDKKASNKKFIRRMTNKCTYLMGEDVVPANSLLYKKFTALNELNNLRIKGHRIDENLKQDIFNDLFKNSAKVTSKKLVTYLKTKVPEISADDLSGFDDYNGGFTSNLSSYMDFNKKVFPGKMTEDAVRSIVEDIIEWKTIYGDDDKMVKEMIKDTYGDILDVDQLKKISNLKYSGWGRLSRKFLSGIEGIDKETGECDTIIGAMWNHNFNLMELLSSRFTYLEEIQKYNDSLTVEHKNFSYDDLVKDLYVSPAVKRSVWRSLLIVEEIKKIKGCEPTKIFVETTRGDDTKGDKGRKSSRKARLLELYASCKDDTRDWVKEIESRDEREFSSTKLFLYYTQVGKCMYSGEPIDVDELMRGSRDWDRDHIYPQSLIKDDSIDNLVLVKRGINARKGKDVLSPEIRSKQINWWKSLFDKGLISKKKYERLTKTGEFTEEELAGFINRQIVVTGQSSMAVVNLLKDMYKSTKVIPVKARITSDFRKDDLNVLKSRLINDLHHAKDAYLNIVTGNVYDAKFTSNPRAWLKSNDGKSKNYHMSKIFDFDVYSGNDLVWKHPALGDDNKPLRNENGEKYGGTLDLVRKTANKNNVLYTEYSYCEKGALFNETHVNKNGGAKIPLKKGLDPNKYGGYQSASTSYFALIEFDGKKGERVRNIMEVPIYVANMLEHNPNAYIEYLENIKELKNVKVLRGCIKKNSLLKINGYPMRIRGANEVLITFKGATQLCMNDSAETIRCIEKFLDKDYKDVDIRDKALREELLIDLYDDLIKKFETVYSKRPSNPIKKLIAGREAFVCLDAVDKIKLLNQIILLTRCDNTTTSNLSLINAGSNTGSMAVKKNTVGSSSIVLVNQSITGLFENEIEL